MRITIVGLMACLTLAAGCASRGGGKNAITPDQRSEAVARAQVWRPISTASLDIRRGPGGRGAFAPDQVVSCTYDDRELSGNTPKFGCRLANGDDIKVKYGRENGEVYAEVAATRLLWALGFGADAMYPVRIRCTGCPDETGKVDPTRVREFEIAAIERKMPGRELTASGGGGWSWKELDAVDSRRGGAPRAHRDALKLLAAMLQHTDNKKEQQRLLCLDETSPAAAGAPGPCRRPFMMISDLGKTFGKANAFNRDGPGSVNLEAWESAEVWDQPTGCRANLDRSITGELENPAISDEGRRFLAARLRLLTDSQLRALFTVARFPARARATAAPGDPVPGAADWVKVFKDKVRQISDRSCAIGPAGE
jgi:hypothetical protein